MSLVNQQLLQTALTNISNQIQTMTVSPKPTYSIDGVSYSWGEHFNNLIKALKDIREQVQAEDAAFEVVQSPGYVDNAWGGPGDAPNPGDVP